MARKSDAEVNHRKFAIMHAGLVVIPKRGGRRRAFETKDEARSWAAWNYRGNNWEVIQLTKDWRKTTTELPNGRREGEA